MAALIDDKNDTQNKTVALKKITENETITQEKLHDSAQTEHVSVDDSADSKELSDNKTVAAQMDLELSKTATEVPSKDVAETIAAAPLFDALLACKQDESTSTESLSEQEQPDAEAADEDLDAVEDIEASDQVDLQNDQKYQVNVKHYADYDLGHRKNIYSEDTKEKIQYAAKTLWGRFVGDLFSLLFRPKRFWESQEEHPATLTEALLPHLAVLVLIRAIASFIGSFVSSESGIKALGQALMQGLFIFVFVFTLSLCYSAVVAFTGKSFDYNRSLRFVCYVISPILVAGILSVIPINHFAAICDLLAMPYAFYVMGYGVVTFLKIPEKSASPITGLLCGIMMCLWGALPILLPYVLGPLIS